MRKLEFSVAGLEDQKRRLRHDSGRQTGAAIAAIASLFVLFGRERSPTEPPEPADTAPPTGQVAPVDTAAVADTAATAAATTATNATVPTGTKETKGPKDGTDTTQVRKPPPKPIVALNANPIRLSFDPQQVGTTGTTRTVSITNTGNTNTWAGYVPGQDPDSAQFDVANCRTYFYLSPQPNVNASSTQCQITVAFHPTAPGDHRARLSIFATDAAGKRVGSSPLAAIDLQGEGISASLDVNPRQLDFRDPQPARQRVILRNTGAAPVSVSIPTVTGANAAQFRFEAASCLQPIAGGAQCEVIVRHSGSSAASQTAELVIEHTAAGSPARVQLTWAPPLVPKFSAEPSSLDFGTVVVGSQASQRVTITNVGSAAATNVVTGLGPQGASSFRIGQGNCTGALPPQASCTVEVLFVPTKAGSLKSNLFIMNATLSGLFFVELSGFAEQPADPAGRIL